MQRILNTSNSSIESNKETPTKLKKKKKKHKSPAKLTEIEQVRIEFAAKISVKKDIFVFRSCKNLVQRKLRK